MQTKKSIDYKIIDELANYKRYCKCGHSMVITPTAKQNRIMCTWCGRWIYKNDYEEFKENIKKVLK